SWWSRCSTGSSAISRRGGPMRAERIYLANGRAGLGALMVILFLVVWEGFSRGWWGELLQPLLGAAAERLRVKPIFISSPTLVAQAAYRMAFVTGELWPDLQASAVGYGLGV